MNSSTSRDSLFCTYRAVVAQNLLFRLRSWRWVHQDLCVFARVDMVVNSIQMSIAGDDMLFKGSGRAVVTYFETLTQIHYLKRSMVEVLRPIDYKCN
jgi:hypothetical protein